MHVKSSKAGDTFQIYGENVLKSEEVYYDIEKGDTYLDIIMRDYPVGVMRIGLNFRQAAITIPKKFL